jgi:hypothetical protein
LPYKCHKPSRTTFGFNWFKITPSSKYMTNIKQYGGLESMQEKWWQGMISLDNKTLLTWITNTEKGIGVYTKIQPFPFAPGHSVIQMMCFIFKMQVKIMGFMSHWQ